MLKRINSFFKTELWRVLVILTLTALVGGITTLISNLDLNLLQTNTRFFWTGILAFFLLIFILLAAIIDLINHSKLNRKYREISKAILDFSSGNFDARVQFDQHDNLKEISENFNNMAGVVKENILSLQKSENLRKELTANIAHDLGGPVTAILGFSQTLINRQTNNSSKELLEYLEIISSNAKIIQTLVKQLSDLASLEESNMRLNKEYFNLPKLIDNILLSYINVDREFRKVWSKEDLSIMADPNLIRRVITNLIDNAIKFSKKNTKIIIALTPVDNFKVEVKISDEGIGINDEEQKNIFRRFYRTDEARTKNDSGYGLGLAIVERILELHECKIYLKSEKNKGSEFFFII